MCVASFIANLYRILFCNISEKAHQELWSKDLVEEFTKLADNGEEFELKSVFGKFSLDALASSAFGVNADSFKVK